MGALSHRRGPEPPGTRCVTGNFVLQQEAKEEDQRHHHVAHGVKYDGTLRIAESRHVNEKSQEGEEGGRQTDNGHHPDKITSKRQLFTREIHIRTGGGAVPDPHEGVAELWVNFEFPGTPEAVVPLDGDG